MVNRWLLLGSVLSLQLAGCSSDSDPTSGVVLSDSELEIAGRLSPLPEPPKNPTNAFAEDPAAAELGQRLFFETSYAGPLTVADDGSNGGLGALGERGKVGCISCHNPSAWFVDVRSIPNNVSLGAGYTPRNAPSLVNVAYYEFFGWGEKQDWLSTQAAGSPESKDNTAGNRLQYAHMMFDKYRADYDAIFPEPLDPALDPTAADAARFPAEGRPKSSGAADGPWESMAAEDRTAVMRIMSNAGKSIEAFERLLVSRDAPFDRFVAGDKTAISESAKRGLRLFIGKAACVQCHSGPTFTDNEVHNTGVPQAVGEHVPDTDDGHFTDAGLMLMNGYNGASQFSDDKVAGAAKLAKITVDQANSGAFRTKSLRHVEHTGPYMHNGSMTTLAEVVDFYDQGGGETGFVGSKDSLLLPLNLSSAERADLVSFLLSLSGEAVPDELTTPPDPRP